jgi:hypothetical protein
MQAIKMNGYGWSSAIEQQSVSPDMAFTGTQDGFFFLVSVVVQESTCRVQVPCVHTRMLKIKMLKKKLFRDKFYQRNYCAGVPASSTFDQPESVLKSKKTIQYFPAISP